MSNSEKLLDAIGEVNDKNIPDIFGENFEEPEKIFISHERKKGKFVLLRRGLAGCGLIAAVTAIAFIGMSAFNNIKIYGSVFAPKLTVIEANMYTVLDSDESFWAAELSELNSDNPWNSDMDIAFMPVYKKSEKQTDLSQEEMERMISETAEKLGLTEPLFTAAGISFTTTGTENEKTASLTGYYEGAANVEIKINADGSGVVTFGDHFSDNYKLDSEYKTRETLSKIGENFNCLFGFDAPTPNIINEGRSRVDGKLYRSYAIFDCSGDIEEQILNFCCGSKYISFSDGSLKSLTFGSSKDSFELVGNYPIISYDEAAAHLAENRFITAVPMLKEDGSRRIITKEDIGRGELIYCTVSNDYRMPFYKFYVKLGSTETPSEMTEYGLYYVPAVTEQYLSEKYTADLPGICWKIRYSNGLEIFNANDPSEIGNDNPWNSDMEFSELPVYKNLTYTEFSHSDYFDMSALTAMAKATAEKLGLTDEAAVSIKPTFIGKNEDVLYSVEAVCMGEKYGVNEIGIEVTTIGDIKVSFGSVDSDGYKLPEGLSFDGGEAERAALEYVAESFKELFGFDNPAVDIRRTGRSSDGKTGYNELYIYDSSEDNVPNILNYGLNSVRVSGKGDRLQVLRIYNRLDSAMNIGNYPIISMEEAAEILTDGKFYGSFIESAVQNGKINEDIIVSAELTYHYYSNYYLPFYRFCVKLDESEWEMDMEAYGACYVPAVEGKYLVMKGRD